MRSSETTKLFRSSSVELKTRARSEANHRWKIKSFHYTIELLQPKPSASCEVIIWFLFDLFGVSRHRNWDCVTYFEKKKRIAGEKKGTNTNRISDFPNLGSTASVGRLTRNELFDSFFFFFISKPLNLESSALFRSEEKVKGFSQGFGTNKFHILTIKFRLRVRDWTERRAAREDKQRKKRLSIIYASNGLFKIII